MRVYIVLWLTLFAHDFQRVEDYRVKVKRGRTGRNVKAPTWNSSKSSVTRTSLFEQRREKRAIAQAGYGNEGGQEGQPFLANITADAVHQRPTSPPLAGSPPPVLRSRPLIEMPRPSGPFTDWSSPVRNAFTFRRFTKKQSISDAILVIDYETFVKVWRTDKRIFMPGYGNGSRVIADGIKSILLNIAKLEARVQAGKPPVWIVATNRDQSSMDTLFQEIQWTAVRGRPTMNLLQMLKGTNGGVVGLHGGLLSLGPDDPRSVFEVAVSIASASRYQKVAVAEEWAFVERRGKNNRNVPVGIKLWQRFTDATDKKKFDTDILDYWSRHLPRPLLEMSVTDTWVPLLIEYPSNKDCFKKRREKEQEQIKDYERAGFTIDAICNAFSDYGWWEIASNGTLGMDIDLGGFEALDTVGEVCGEGAFGCMGDVQ